MLLVTVALTSTGFEVGLMSETAAEQRARILAEGNTAATDYDMALALGYEAESWDGMWRLIQKPFTFINGYVVAREASLTRGMKVDSHGGVRVRVRCVKVPA